MATTIADDLPDIEENTSNNRGWMIATGVIMILAGTGALVFPLISSFGVAICVAILLAVAGFAQIIHAFSYPTWGKITLAVLVGILWLLAGIVLMARPLDAVFVLTILVAAAFLAEGLLKTIFAIKTRPETGWGWILFDGIMAAAIGILLWWQLPFSALWTLGLLAGINILISGWALVMLAGAIRKPAQSPEAGKSSA